LTSIAGQKSGAKKVVQKKWCKKSGAKKVVQKKGIKQKRKKKREKIKF
jgi:hypothetical protein